MAIPYRTAKFKSANILTIAILGLTAKSNSCHYFWLYGSHPNIHNYVYIYLIHAVQYCLCGAHSGSPQLCMYIREQNKVFKMSGHDGQPIPKLVGHLLHLLHLLGHATESRSLSVSSLYCMLVQLELLVGCTKKPQIRSINLTTGIRAHLAQQ